MLKIIERGTGYEKRFLIKVLHTKEIEEYEKFEEKI